MLHIVEIIAHGTRASLACIFNDIAADDLALQGARVWQSTIVQVFLFGWDSADIIQTSICMSDLCDANRTKFPVTKMHIFAYNIKTAPQRHIKQMLFFSELDFMVNWCQNHKKPLFNPM